jgi:phage-related protein (TIGR01555 family)
MSEDILDIFNADSADEVSDIRFDATMSNLLTKMGTGSDRTTQTIPHGVGYWGQQTLEDLAEHLILNRVVSAKVDAATQKGWELTLGSDGDDDILEDFNDIHDDLEVEEAFNEAQFQANVYGGAVIIIIVDDKKPAYEPIDIKNLKKIVKLEVLDRYKVEPVLALTDVNPLRPDKYRLVLPEYVRKSLKNVTEDNPQYIIDKSRIIRFDADGIRATPDMLRKNQGWTKSLLAALWEDYLEWKTSLKATGAMVQDASIFIYKLKDLSAMMKSKDSLLLEGRIKLFRSMLSVIGGAIIDAEKESMEFISRNFAGVPEVANQQRDNFIGVSDIPHTKLFGESPSGLGASGESEQKDWASTIADFQTSKWRKKLRGLFKLIFLSKEGPTKGELIKGWSIKFHNLMVESEAEKISNMATMASTDQTYISAGVLLIEEVRKSRFGKSGFSIETTLDDSLFKKQQDEAKQQAQDPYGGYGGFPEEQAPSEELPPEEVQQDSYDYRADAVDISNLKQKDGKVFYLGKWWQPDNPMPSDRAGKKRMVLAKEGNQVALVHYGAEGYKHNYSPEAKKDFLARMQGIKTKDGKPAYKDKFSPAYWAIKDLWNPNEPADGSAKYDAMGVGGFADELNASSYSRPKKVLNWNNISIGLTHEAGDVRFPMSEPMKCGYGHIRGSYGDAPDKKALDVYVGDDLKSSNGYKVRQLDPKTGFYDEDKYFIGFRTPEDVRSNFIYHAGASRFGGIEPIKPDELSVYRQDNCGCSVPEIDTGTKVLSGDRQINVVNDKNITDAISSIYPEKISSLDNWTVAGNGNIFGEFSSEYGTYKFGIKKGSSQDVLTYKWNRESREDSRVNERKGYHWVNNKEAKGGGYWRKNPPKSLHSPETTQNNSEKTKSKPNGAGIALGVAGGVAALGIAGGVTALALASRGGSGGTPGNTNPPDTEVEKTKAKAEQEARARSEQAAKVKAENEAKAKAEQERIKQEQAAKVKAENEAKAKAEQERVKREQEAKAKSENEAKVKAEQERVKREQEAKAKSEVENRPNTGINAPGTVITPKAKETSEIAKASKITESGVLLGLDAINKVHSLKGLPRFDIRIDAYEPDSISGAMETGRLLGESSQSNMTFRKFEINAKAVRNRGGNEKDNELYMATVAIHEMGHAIDLLLLGKNKKRFTSATVEEGDSLPSLSSRTEESEMSSLMNTLRDTRALKDIEAVGKRNSEAKQFADYLLDPREVFARAYTQYVVTKSGDKELLKPLYVKNQGAFGHGHWDEQEFNSKVLPEFDKLFSNKGLLR